MRCALLAGAVLVAALVPGGCQQGVTIREVAGEHGGLHFFLQVSPSPQSGNQLYGKLRVVNDAGSARRYSNRQLSLVCAGNPQLTRIDSENVGNLVDTGLVTLMPGDTLEFFTFWEYPEKIDFPSASLSLQFDEHRSAVVSETIE